MRTRGHEKSTINMSINMLQLDADGNNAHNVYAFVM